MDTFGTSAWVKFFTDSGIPHGVACNYAVTFTDNRITKNMLLDLNKEILQDMGISVMGDVIAILKHSKVVHDQITRAKVFESEASVAPVLPERRTTPITRLVDHYTKQKVTAVPWTKTPSTLSVQPMEPVPVSQPPVTAKRTLVQSQDPPPKKARRVLPEHEGGYKISMPAGSTPKTKRLLQQQKALAAQSPVFQRLGMVPRKVPGTGSPRVSKVATTNVVKKKVTMANPLTQSTKVSSVFARLGPEMSSGGEDDFEQDEINTNAQRTEPLPYQGILKTAIGVKKTIILPQKTERPSPIVKTTRKLAMTTTKHKFVSTPEVRRIAAPLFTTKTPVAATGRVGVGSQGILASRKALATPGVQDRLGAKARLGPAPAQAEHRVAIMGPSKLRPTTLSPQTNFSTVVRTTRKVGAPQTAVTKTIVKKLSLADPPTTIRPGRGILPKKQLGVFGRLGPMVDI